MDPNAALAVVHEWLSHLSDEENTVDETELADALENLDGWLSRGGFLPTAWSGGRSRE